MPRFEFSMQRGILAAEDVNLMGAIRGNVQVGMMLGCLIEVSHTWVCIKNRLSFGPKRDVLPTYIRIVVDEERWCSIMRVLGGWDG
jgi:hypothetical protein